MTSKPTMQDVAERAGVSRSLVSLVFQGSDKVSATRTAAVHRAAKELGYRPNRLARNLAQGRTMTLGVVVDDLLNPFFAMAVDGIERAAAPAGYQVLLSNGGRDLDRGRHAARTLIDLQVDGLILVGMRGELEPLIDLGRARPTVLVTVSAETDVIDSVSVDEVLGCRLAIEHLAGLGHRSISHIDGGSGASAEGRRSGYRSAMTALGLESHIDIIGGEFTHEGGATAAVHIARRTDSPTAVFAGNDLIAAGLWTQLARLGERVPDNRSIVGFDDSAHLGFGDATLTTIRQPSEEMGARAAELLLERIDGRTNGVHELIEPSLVVRSSTASPT